MCGSEETTTGVEPRLKAMSWVAPRFLAMEARVLWANPRLKLNKLPNTGRPLGPGMEAWPFWFLPCFQACPPAVKTQNLLVFICWFSVDDNGKGGFSEFF
ncbi:hypothetical protein NE237_029348 [Protea cynaroides]|uniref:Uncharacterized protein n=1 Tax=Protea cynaroides TaxID=273540 RepID=A0A9Q0JUQ1_9MAGN|nr:hypothetical protein NE237_029348 [Protea cynaroides]